MHDVFSLRVRGRDSGKCHEKLPSSSRGTVFIEKAGCKREYIPHGRRPAWNIGPHEVSSRSAVDVPRTPPAASPGHSGSRRLAAPIAVTLAASAGKSRAMLM